MQNKPELSIIIVSYNVRQLLLNCIQSVIDTSEGIDYEIIIVDNASSDDTVSAVREAFPMIQVIANKENVGFAKANNQGYVESKGEYLLLLNPDTIVKIGAIKAVLEFMKSTHDAGIAGCRLLNPDGSLQKSIRGFPSIMDNIIRALFLDRIICSHYWSKTHYKGKPFNIDYCTGAFMMIRRKALGEMPLLNPEFFMYAEEKEVALRLKRRGWNTYFVPYGEVIHYGGKSTDQKPVEMFLELQKSQVKYFTCHYKGCKQIIAVWTYWLVLCASCLASLPFAISSYGRYRLKLFIIAAMKYPAIVAHLNH